MRRTVNSIIRTRGPKNHKKIIGTQRKQKNPTEKVNKVVLAQEVLKEDNAVVTASYSECFAAGDDIKRDRGESCVAVTALSAIHCRHDTSAHESVLMGHGLLG